jgi:hypothetical protein
MGSVDATELDGGGGDDAGAELVVGEFVLLPPSLTPTVDDVVCLRVAEYSVVEAEAVPVTPKRISWVVVVSVDSSASAAAVGVGWVQDEPVSPPPRSPVVVVGVACSLVTGLGINISSDDAE